MGLPRSIYCGLTLPRSYEPTRGKRWEDCSCTMA